MTLIELKKCIESQVIPNDFIIFLCSDNSFIADQYIEAICEINNLTKTSINSLQSQASALSLVMGQNDELNVLKVDVFEEALIDYSNLTNTVVVCNKIDKKIKSLVEDYVIQIPKLVDWQVKSYISKICPSLDQDEVDWLYQATNGDIYRIINELDKLLLFPVNERKNVLSELRFNPGSDLYSLTIFDLAEGIIRNNKPLVLDFLRHDNLSFDLMSITGAMLNTVKNIILLTQNSGKTAADLGLSSGRAWHLKQDWKGFPASRLQMLLQFLSGIDLKLKSGLLDMSKEAQIDYLITNTIL